MAKAWGKLPSEFWAASDEDKAWMIAHDLAEGQMYEWERQQQQQKK